MTPEIIKGEGHNMAVYWWTVCIVMFEILTGATAFEVRGEENKLKLYNRIVTDTPIMQMEFSSHARDFIERLLDKDPNKRLGGRTDDALEVKSRPFFNGLNWTHVAQKITCMPYMPPINCDVVADTNQDWSFSPTSAELSVAEVWRPFQGLFICVCTSGHQGIKQFSSNKQCTDHGSYNQNVPQEKTTTEQRVCR
jgi:serine/threonine protein kinase